ncbi:toll/interleukin-1 receptor domain-containing protein [Streptomyces sp. NPDC100445]|uniref:toll/interleukin-1 receptor domain-containing protein n=1 Tax=Streptomyces sp. NPDC100445 TaxID=3366102 RepID=UPI00382E8441
MGLRVFVSHGAGRDACVKDALERLVPELEERGYSVFVDMDSLRNGDRWSDEVYFELYTCDAAIVLLGPKTVEGSEWVRRESDILMSRYHMHSLPHVLPVLLGGVTSREARKHGFGPLMTLQASIEDRTAPLDPVPGPDADPGHLVDWALREFAHVGDVPTCADTADWARRIAAYLDRASKRSASAVVNAARALHMDGIELAQLRARVGSDLLLAFRLMTAAAEQGALLAQALGELRAILDGSSMRGLAEQLMPGWVNAAAARCFLPEVRESGVRGRTVVFAAHEGWMAEHHVQRALYVRPHSWSVGVLDEQDDLPVDERPVAETLLEACRQQLFQVFKVPPAWGTPADMHPTEGVSDYLVVSLADYPLDAVAEVARSLRADFPWLTVVLLAPPDHVPHRKELYEVDLSDAIPVEPAPSRAEQLAAYKLKASVDALLAMCG